MYRECDVYRMYLRFVIRLVGFMEGPKQWGDGDNFCEDLVQGPIHMLARSMRACRYHVKTLRNPPPEQANPFLCNILSSLRAYNCLDWPRVMSQASVLVIEGVLIPLGEEILEMQITVMRRKSDLSNLNLEDIC